MVFFPEKYQDLKFHPVIFNSNSHMRNVNSIAKDGFRRLRLTLKDSEIIMINQKKDLFSKTRNCFQTQTDLKLKILVCKSFIISYIYYLSIRTIIYWFEIPSIVFHHWVLDHEKKLELLFIKLSVIVEYLLTVDVSTIINRL